MITIKDAFAYFMQQYKHGAIMDASISPDHELGPDSTLFEGLNTSSAPWVFTEDIGFRPVPWFIYVPKNDEHAKKRFQTYFNKINRAFDDLNVDAKDCQNGEYKFYGIQKMYFNTHRIDTFTSQTHPAINLLEASAYNEFYYLITEKNISPLTPLPCGRAGPKNTLISANMSTIDFMLENIKDIVIVLVLSIYQPQQVSLEGELSIVLVKKNVLCDTKSSDYKNTR